MGNKLKKHKIGLVTTHYAINFGAVLQAYALFNSIKKINGQCEIIDYTPNNKTIGRKIIYKLNSIKSILYSLMIFINIIFRKNQKTKVKKFDNFLKNNFDFSTQKFESKEDLKDNLGEYDTLVCGSDQIWNLNLFNDETMFLRFGRTSKAKKYISYAPSLGEKMNSDQLKIIAKNINHFTHISVREKDSIKQLSSFTNKNIDHVADPIFLLNESDWKKLIKPTSIEDPYMLVYTVGGTGNFFKEAVNILRKKLNLKLVYINLAPFDKYNSDFNIQNASPEKFISLIYNANFIFTSSFHGTAFSTHFKKQFFTYPCLDRSSRHYSLLKKLNLNDRILDDKNFEKKCLENEIINYSKILHLKQNMIEDSKNYLDNALQDLGSNV